MLSLLCSLGLATLATAFVNGFVVARRFKDISKPLGRRGLGLGVEV